MQENANVERPTSNFDRRSEDKEPLSTSPLEVRHSTCDVRIALQLSIVLAAGLFIYGLWLGDSPLDRTEPFRALVAHQMVKGGSWLVPRLYGELYLRKPPLIYWIEALTEKSIGRGDEFVWRLPSVVGSALLAVFIAWWSGRWFGRRAILPAGFGCLALVAVWDQDRSADIDALNTAFAVVTSVTVLEILYGSGRKILPWAIGLGFSLGATLLLKGPGGLPQIIAAMIGPAVLLRDWKRLRKRALALIGGFVIGFSFFAAYIIAAKSQMRMLHIAPDPTGWFEIIEKIFLHGWISRVKSMAIPFALLIYAMPVSLVLPFAIVSLRTLPINDPDRRRAMAILGTLAATAIIWILGGNDNPRYEYVMLPLLAPLAGFVWMRGKRENRWFKFAMLGVCVLFCIGNVAITAKLVRSPAFDHRFWKWCIFGALLSIGELFRAMRKPKPSNTARLSTASPAITLLLLFAIPMAGRKNLERQHKSAQTPAQQLRSIIGNAPRVSAAGVVRDLPELFYYGNVDVDSYGEFGLPQLVQHRGHWVVVSQGEKYPAYSTIMKYIPHAFPRGITKLNMPDPRDQIYVGWYDPPADANTRIEWNVVQQVEPED